MWMLVLEVFVVGAIAALLIALALVMSQREVTMQGQGDVGVDLDEIMARDKAETPPVQPVTMRDGFKLQCYKYGAPGRDVPLIVMVHASSFYGVQMHNLATSVAKDAYVLVPDLRGHGPKPGRRGDIDYIGQFEDDLSDLIKTHARPDQKVMMVGHSVGAGLVVRMAGGPHGKLIDYAVLLAPFLNHFATTTRRKSAGWARVMMRRIVGLKLLNAVGFRGLNHLTVVQFNLPREALERSEGSSLCTAYSYRLNQSYMLRADFRRDIAALPDFSLLVGARDEAFHAEAYAPLMRAVTDKGLYHVIPGLGHLGLVDAPQTLQIIRDVIKNVQ
ncbi:MULTISPECIES: alpha/beta hydrolase [Roseobacteraceae]|uniref:2-succinyl-6-hydroxy-2, 4-cyclohexadiene-1-carboxylate synthase n=1 Tax=Pseudosulfitobacter pseudonitzschiae TaxID=1402135 RepID=A0A221K0M5_9RHOB|nr:MULTISPECIES: alpha/beta fold hydrolase [Roseobacteraceae]ASM72558.1 2-succinyl-6-hydroxy-2, 4-cyclohexadiene-1-carboxylate synthase [Pseudosulfitobacter pseudonitzschiae]